MDSKSTNENQSERYDAPSLFVGMDPSFPPSPSPCCLITEYWYAIQVTSDAELVKAITDMNADEMVRLGLDTHHRSLALYSHLSSNCWYGRRGCLLMRNGLFVVVVVVAAWCVSLGQCWGENLLREGRSITTFGFYYRPVMSGGYSFFQKIISNCVGQGRGERRCIQGHNYIRCKTKLPYLAGGEDSSDLEMPRWVKDE